MNNLHRDYQEQTGFTLSLSNASLTGLFDCTTVGEELEEGVDGWESAIALG